VSSKHIFSHDDTSLPRQLFFFTRFTAANSNQMWMSIKGYINQLRGETPTNLRMGDLASTTSFAGLEVTMAY
jgi:hypothetical protein